MSRLAQPAQVPRRPSLKSLHEASADCRACGLWRDATQTVFGEGPRSARVLFVGEQRAEEIRACRPWLDAKLRVVKPEIVGCLAATATIHPSAILRMDDPEERSAEMRALVGDLRRVAERLDDA